MAAQLMHRIRCVKLNAHKQKHKYKYIDYSIVLPNFSV